MKTNIQHQKIHFFKKIIFNQFFTSFLAGSLLNLAFAPFYYFIFAIISYSIFFHISDSANSEKNIAKQGWFFGFGFFFFGLYWIANSLLVDGESFAWLIPFAISLIPAILAIYFSLISVIFFIIKKKLNSLKINLTNWQKIVIFSLIFLLMEIARTYLFSGFAWNLAGYIWFFDLRFMQISKIFGVFGITFLAIISAISFVVFFTIRERKISLKFPQKSDLIFFSLIIFVLISSFFYGNYQLKKSQNAQFYDYNFRVVQPNIAQTLKNDQSENSKNLSDHINLSLSENYQNIDLFIWSESSINYLINAQEEVLNKLKNDFFYYLKDEAALFSGSIRADLIEKNHQFEIDKIYNSIVLLDRFGIRDFYDKRHLVPFGEYIPARRLFPFVNKITAGSIDFSSGETGKIINNKNFNFFPIICYEAIFPLKFDKKIRELKPNIIINLTNDGWFGNSSGPRQHFDMTKARAIENSIPLIRVSNSGISAYIDGYGNVIDSINLSERGFFDAKILKETTPSFYFNYGNYSLIIFLIILILLLILTIKRNDEKL